jgi:hypothetical protein
MKLGSHTPQLTPKQRQQINRFVAEKCGITMSMVLQVPDLFASLDHCAVAEASLTVHQAERYNWLLTLAFQREEWNDDHPAANYQWHATAAQRALAIFQTLGGQL